MRIINREKERKKKKSDAPTRSNIVPWAARDEEKKKGGNLAQQNVWPARIRRRWMKSSHYPGKYLPFSNRRETKRFSRLMTRLYVARFERDIIELCIDWAVNSKKKKRRRKKTIENFRSVYLKYNFLKNILTPGNLHHLSTIVYIYILVPNKTILSTFVGSIYVEVIELFEGSTRLGITARVVEKKF